MCIYMPDVERERRYDLLHVSSQAASTARLAVFFLGPYDLVYEGRRKVGRFCVVVAGILSFFARFLYTMTVELLVQLVPFPGDK